jgi:CBS domain-containing protein
MPTQHPVKNYMTELPHSVGRDISIAKAQEMMREYSCHHLPVLDGGKLVGVVSQRDLSLVTNSVERTDLTVEEVMTADPLIVEADSALSVVAKSMLEKQYGSAIVQAVPGGHWGIFTVSDALRFIVGLKP